MKRSGKFGRVLAVLCIAAMLVTMFPSWMFFSIASYAEEQQETEAEAEKSEQPSTAEETKAEEEKPETESEAKPQTEEAAEPETEKEAEPVDKSVDTGAAGESAAIAKPEDPTDSKADVKEKKVSEEKEKKSEDKEKTDSDKKKVEKKPEKEEEGFKVEFEFGDNYGRFSAINPKTTNKDGEIELPEKPKARDKIYETKGGTKYYFTGWKYEDEEYEPGEKVSLKKDAVFTAVWKQIYTIEFSAEGIKADEVKDQTEVFGESVVLPEEAASKDGISFIGWTPDNGKTVYKAGTVIKASSIQPKKAAGDIVLKLDGVTEDTIAPTVTITISEKNDAKADLSIKAEDKGSDVASLKYYVSSADMSDYEGIEESEWSEISGASGTVSVENQKYLIVKAIDGKGNVTYAKRYVDCGSIEADADNLKITVNKVVPETTTYSDSYAISFTTSAGKEAITGIEVSVDGEEYDVLEADADSAVISDLEDGTHNVKLCAVGEWGSRTETTAISLSFDGTAPAVEAEMAASSDYYKADNCGIKVTASDAVSGIAKIEVSAKAGGNEIELGSATTATYELTASEVASKLGSIEDKVKVTATATDKAGNKKSCSLEFEYDVVGPRLVSANTVKASTEEAFYNNNYYHDDSAVTTYTVDEKNLDTIELTYKKDGIDASGVADVTKNRVTGNWNSEGTYSEIKVTAVDKAGNKLVLGVDYKSSVEDAVDQTASADGVIAFKYGKVIDTTAPTATVIYDTGISPVTGEKAKMHLFKGADGMTEAYVSGSVEVVKVRIEDNFLFPGQYSWVTNDGLATITASNIKPKLGGGFYAELDGVEILSTEGETVYKVYGHDFALNALKVTERYETGVELVPHNGAAWPAEAKAAFNALGKLQIKFIKDVTPPEYDSTFSEVNNDENVEADSVNEGQYTAYYGQSAESKISAGFNLTDANYDAEQAWVKMAYKTGNDFSKIDLKEADSTETLKFKAETGNTYSVSKEITGDEKGTNNGAYRFFIKATDKAGNELVMSSAEKTKAEAEGSAGYNKTLPYGMSEPGKFHSFTKVLDTVAPGYGLKISDEAKDGYLVKYSSNVAEDKRDLGTDGTYEPFRKNNTATVLAKGYDSSPVKLQYKFSSVDAGSKETVWIDSELYSSQGYPKNHNEKILSKEKKGETQFRVKDLLVKDRAGNEVSLAESNTVYLDGSEPEDGKDLIKPEVHITSATKAITSHDTDYKLYNKDVDLKFTVTDPNQKKSSSGLQHVWYTASVEGQVIDKGKLIAPYDDDAEDPFSNGDLLNRDKATTTKNVEEKGDEALRYTITRTIRIPKGLENGYESNNIVITLHAVDNADNVAEPAVETMGIDSIAPKVSVSVSGKSVRKNEYFNANRIAVVKVVDRNIGKTSDTVDISTETYVTGTWNYEAGKEQFGNEDIWTKKIYYDEDGDYTLKISGSDEAGNPIDVDAIQWSGEHPKKFTVDKTKPVIKVDFDNNSVRNAKYYKANRTATITINEHNFSDPDAKVNGKASAPRNGAMGFPGRTKFSSKKDVRKASIDFTKEGNYNFSVNFVDRAGNKAKTVTIPEFVIDKTAPVVKIENVSANGIYSGAIAPRASFDDDNFDKSNSTFRFTGAKSGDRTDLSGGMKENEYGGTYTMSDFPRLRNNDDIYTAYAASTDMAGNATTVQLSFSVNRFGSTFDYNDDAATAALVSKKAGTYYTNKQIPLVLREINVNELKKHELTLYRDDTSFELEEGKDYNVNERAGNGGYQYVYIINKDVMSEEGSYNIVVNSEDSAGNLNTNASIRNENGVNEVPLRFVYDVTAPTVSFLDLADNNKLITLNRDALTSFRGIAELALGIKPDDEWALSAIEIRLRGRNGEPDQVYKYEGEEFQEVMGEDKVQYFEEIIKSGSETQYLDITVWDAAGNTTDTMTYQLLITANIFELMIHYWYYVLAGLAAAAGLIIYLVRRNKNKEEQVAQDL